METAPGYRDRIDGSDSVKITATQIERIVNELEAVERLNLDEEDGLTSKLDVKLSQKELAEDDGTNEWSNWKRLGIFIVNERTLDRTVSAVLMANGLDICDDETVLELHIPPQTIEEGDRLASFLRLQQYLDFHSSTRRLPVFVYGISYLAQSAEKYGFSVVDLPDAVKEKSGPARLLKKWAGSADERKRRMAEFFTVNDIKLAYLSVDEFMSSPDYRLRYEQLASGTALRSCLRKKASLEARKTAS